MATPFDRVVDVRPLAQKLYKIYLDACICSIDYYSTCNCEAQYEIGQLLEDLLGPEWHTICNEVFKE